MAGLDEIHWRSLETHGFCILDIPASDFQVLDGAREAMRVFFTKSEEEVRVSFDLLFT
eukprot:m.97092 g.97092  ORF g.97092 m.97092 type:complete len:58 (+) comp13964_c0_seq3:89-262(+)